MTEEKRIYAVVAATVQPSRRNVVQVPGRQIAQVAHVVSKLRLTDERIHPLHNGEFIPITTIVLQCRDSAELNHNWHGLNKKKLAPVWFLDTNEAVYGPGEHQTAIAVYATREQIAGILDYLPLWGAQ